LEPLTLKKRQEITKESIRDPNSVYKGRKSTVFSYSAAVTVRLDGTHTPVYGTVWKNFIEKDWHSFKLKGHAFNTQVSLFFSS
jgi:hypothetical protein